MKRGLVIAMITEDRLNVLEGEHFNATKVKEWKAKQFLIVFIN